jgi:hypothetical protein
LTANLLLDGCPLQRARLRIVGVHCSTCILPARRALEKAEIVALIKKVGYEAITLAAPYF